MLSENDIRKWRDTEKERLKDIHNPMYYKLCKNTIDVLTTILEDD